MPTHGAIGALALLDKTAAKLRDPVIQTWIAVFSHCGDEVEQRGVLFARVGVLVI
jgi:hypothetical protein